VCFNPEYAWITVLGSHGHDCAAPEMPRSFDDVNEDVRISEMTAPSHVHRANKTQRRHFLKIVLDIFEFIIIEQDIPTFSATLLEFMMRAGFAIKDTHHNSDAKSEPRNDLKTKVVSEAHVCGDPQVANQFSKTASGLGSEDVEQGQMLESELRIEERFQNDYDGLQQALQKTDVRAPIDEKRLRHIVDKMFDPELFSSGVPLNDFHMNLCRLQRTPHDELVKWLEMFETRIKCFELKRSAGQRDRGYTDSSSVAAVRSEMSDAMSTRNKPTTIEESTDKELRQSGTDSLNPSSSNLEPPASAGRSFVGCETGTQTTSVDDLDSQGAMGTPRERLESPRLQLGSLRADVACEDITQDGAPNQLDGRHDGVFFYFGEVQYARLTLALISREKARARRSALDISRLKFLDGVATAWSGAAREKADRQRHEVAFEVMKGELDGNLEPRWKRRTAQMETPNCPAGLAQTNAPADPSGNVSWISGQLGARATSPKSLSQLFRNDGSDSPAARRRSRSCVGRIPMFNACMQDDVIVEEKAGAPEVRTTPANPYDFAMQEGFSSVQPVRLAHDEHLSMQTVPPPRSMRTCDRSCDWR